MHLSKLPTIFVKNGEERKVYFTVQARELQSEGWVEKGTEKPVKAPAKTAAPKAESVAKVASAIKAPVTKEDKKGE